VPVICPFSCIFACDSASSRGAEYCDERACLSLCLSARQHIFDTTRPILFLCVLAVAMVRSFFSGEVAICCVLPVLWMTSYVHIMVRNRRREKAYAR